MSRPDSEPLDQAYEAVWNAFVSNGQVEPAFGTRSSGDNVHLVFLCPVGQSSDAAELIASVQQQIAFPYADPVPRQRLHVSIQGLDVDNRDWDQRREELFGAARSVFAQVPAFTLRFARPNSFPMAAILQADDGGMIRRLRAELRQDLPAWAGAQRDPMVRDGQDTWLPHLSLAYYNAVEDNRALVEAIRPLRDQLVAEVLVTEIHLISTPVNLTGDERWTWPVHGVFKLEGSG